MNETPTQSPDQGPEHNPDGLTPEQYGAPEWRLLREGEKACGSDEGWHKDHFESCLNIGPVHAEWAPYLGTYRRRVAQPTAEQARNIEGDFEEPEYTRLKAQKDAIVERENERLRDEGRKSVVLIRCINCLSVPQQNKSEITEAECGGCIAKERDAALARIAELERERDEARAEREKCGDAINLHIDIEARLRAQLAASEKDRDAAVSAFLDSAEVWDLLTVSPLTLAHAGRGLRALGHEIPQKMEQECGYVLRLALHKIVEHGPEWRKAFAAEFDAAMKEAK